jgi:hypothetical protein
MNAVITSHKNITTSHFKKIARFVKGSGYQLQDGYKSHCVKSIPETIQPPVKVVLEQRQSG